ncbi:hypothetical protein AB7310_11975 [Cylindrospermopsis raciborskii UAM/DH-BiRr]|jgi:hypothetical protein|uniref:hypothetical protein n=2 Tax=Cylindrospermopsis raciborskii TaxID=77022 RepID=UPI000E1F966E|nr:hypothetical protein [Cylindrospermopsis raciborskii]UJS04868.1 hypothetical protein L3I90_00965 [Cylindrospermopsis raciborskii KLL07]
MNKIVVSPDLAYLDYSDLLNKILGILKQKSLFSISPDGCRMRIDIEEVATEVMRLNPSNPLVNDRSARAATLNFSPNTHDLFRKQIEKIAIEIQDKLTLAMQKNGEYHDRVEFIRTLTSDINEFQGNYREDNKTRLLDLTYPFPEETNLKKQRLTVRQNDNSKNQQLLKAHKVKIHVDKPCDFTTTLIKGINNYINIKFADVDQEDKEDLEYVISNLEKSHNSDIYKLQNLLNQETLGKLKKFAKIKYLEFLLEQVDGGEGKLYLQDLIRRLKLLEDYINDTSKADGDYQVSYAGATVNYRELFSRSEAYDILPIIPLIEGYLGEVESPQKDAIEFTFGIKMKLDGKVQAHQKNSSFDYHLDLLNPDGEEHKTAIAESSKKSPLPRKVLKTVFLYCFIFESNESMGSDLEYNPIEFLENKILPTLKGNDDQAKKRLFKNCIKRFEELKIKEKINKTKELIKNIIKRKTPYPVRHYPLHISVKESILENDLDTIIKRTTFFKEVLQKPKECLQYINLGEATTQGNLLITLPANISISEIHFLKTEDQQIFDMKYDLVPGIKVLPVLFLSMKEGQKFYHQHLKSRRLLIFPHRSETDQLETNQEFIYKITYSLLTYICLYVILENQSKIFVPLLRIHQKEKTDNAPIENFIVCLTKVLSHLLNNGYRSNQQGIVINKSQTSKINFKIPNVLTSLYSVLPRKFQFKETGKFTFQEIDKLAIIIISSRETDSVWSGKYKSSNLVGEIIILEVKEKTVRFQLLKTFSENYEDHQKMFEYPTVIVDNVDQLYSKGYKHFIYISKVPYSSTLHITQKEKNEELFFMSKNVIKSLKKERDNIKIYPMFFDKYYAVKLENFKLTSLYIQDTLELTNLAEDKNKQAVIFFNLFNGFSLGDSINYHGVMSYATLLNIYDGILDDEDIRKGLIYNNSQLKDEILQCLTLFHFYRYKKTGNSQLKLDPYENLIGDESVTQCAVLKHIREKVDFNSLAFLTYIKSIISQKNYSTN